MASSGNGARRPGRPAPAAPGWALAAGIALALVIAALALRAAAGSALHTPQVGYGATALVALAALAAGLTALRFYRRRAPRRALRGTAAERLRSTTLAALGTLTLAVPGALLIFGRISLHRTGSPQSPATLAPPSPRISAGPSAQSSRPARPGAHWHLDLTPLLIGLAAVAGAIILAAVAYFLYTLARGPLTGPAPGGDLAAGPEQDQEQDALADALLAGRSALAGDDARAAIIACYAAMEESLAAAGIARLASDSPTDLLRRAVQRGVADRAATARLTDLFREARYSTHPMSTAQLADARAALDAVTAALPADTPPPADETPQAAGAATGTPQDARGPQ